MADLMAFCNKCGYSFYSGFSLGANSTVSNCGSACPNCKNMVTLNAQTDENGKFKNFSKLAFATLTAASFPIYDLERLKDLIKVKPNNSDISSERELVEVIKQEKQLFSEFEIEFNSLVRKHFPHWEAKDILKN